MNELCRSVEPNIVAAYGRRAPVLQALASEGERIARIAAWECFADGSLRRGVVGSGMSELARGKYLHALETLDEGGLFMDISAGRFVTFFSDEFSVIRTSVGAKGARVAFYLAIALALAGLYKLLS